MTFDLSTAVSTVVDAGMVGTGRRCASKGATALKGGGGRAWEAVTGEAVDHDAGRACGERAPVRTTSRRYDRVAALRSRRATVSRRAAA